jgi:hypothetical protein
MKGTAEMVNREMVNKDRTNQSGDLALEEVEKLKLMRKAMLVKQLSAGIGHHSRHVIRRPDWIPARIISAVKVVHDSLMDVQGIIVCCRVKRTF